MKKEWFEEKEQGAGIYRLELLWIIYKSFNKRVLKLILIPISFLIFLCAVSARKASRSYLSILNNYQRAHGLRVTKFSPFSHILSYVFAVVDKFDIYTLKKNIPEFVSSNDDIETFKRSLSEGRGCFLISSHLGNGEAALGVLNSIQLLKPLRVHVFMQVSQSAIFHEFIKKHLSFEMVVFHAVEEIGIETAALIDDELKKGALVVMAGDRVSAKVPEKFERFSFLGKEVRFPSGVFKFVQLMNAPTFFIHCLKERGNSYRLFFKEVPEECFQKSHLRGFIQLYVKNLETLTLKYPLQWYHFYQFFV